MHAFKHCLLLPFVLIAGAFQAQAQKPDTLRRKDAGGWEFIQVRQDDKVTLEGNRLNGREEGVWTYYWDNGFPHTITTYRAGQRHGQLVSVTRIGVIEFTEQYANNLLEGPRRVYAPGMGAIEETYYADGKQSGAYFKKYPNGQIQETSNFNNGVRDGKTSWYFEDGARAADYSYRQGIMDGDATLYHKNGNVSEFGQYASDNQTGHWKEYYESGKLKAEGDYKNGQKEGVWKQYAEDGKPGKPITYKKGVAKR